MKKLLLFLFGMFYLASVSQNDKAYLDTLVSEFTKSLENRNIDEYIYLNKNCIGTTEMFKLKDGNMCVSKGTYYEVYIFWKEEDESMIKKIDNCGLYYSLPLENSNILDFSDKYRKEIEVGKVKRYEVENPENVPTQSTKIHSCYRIFQFSSENNSYGQIYNLYDLTNESKYKNRNFESNSKLKIVELEKMIEAIILEMNPNFSRQ